MFALNSNPAVMKYIRAPETPEESAATLLRVLATYGARPGLGVWRTERISDGAFLGFHILKHLDQTQLLEVGVPAVSGAWGQGYATEGSHALLDHAFQGLSPARVDSPPCRRKRPLVLPPRGTSPYAVNLTANRCESQRRSYPTTELAQHQDEQRHRRCAAF